MNQDINNMAAASGRVLQEDSKAINWAENVTTNGIHVTELEFIQLEKGLSFCGTHIFENAGSGDTEVIHVKTGDKPIIIVYIIDSDNANRCAAYYNPTITTNGTLFDCPGFSRNLINPQTQTVELYHTPTYTDLGTKLAERQTSAGTKPNDSGERGGDSRVLIVPPNSEIIYTSKNVGSDSCTMSVSINWLELEE